MCVYESVEVRGRDRGEMVKENKHMEIMMEELTLTQVKKDVEIEGQRSKNGGENEITTACMSKVSKNVT